MKRLNTIIDDSSVSMGDAVEIATERGLKVTTVKDAYLLFGERAERIMNAFDLADGVSDVVPLAVNGLRIDLKAVESYHARYIDELREQARRSEVAALTALCIALVAVLTAIFA